MNLKGAISSIVPLLDEIGIRHMIVGSVASSTHALPRSTLDIDIVVEISLGQLEQLIIEARNREMYLAEAYARTAVQNYDQFNVIAMNDDWKADLIVLEPTPFHLSEFERRQRTTLWETTVFIASPEDTIISKLRWARDGGGSERQLNDVSGVIEVQGPTLNWDYLEHWCAELDITYLLNLVRDALAADGG